MRLSCYWQWISSQHCQSSLRIHLAIASWIHSYFDNVVTKFMINNRTDAWKTDVNLLILQTQPLSWIRNNTERRKRVAQRRRSIKSLCKSDAVVVVCAASRFKTLSKKSKIEKLPYLINFSQFALTNFHRIGDKQCNVTETLPSFYGRLLQKPLSWRWLFHRSF